MKNSNKTLTIYLTIIIILMVSLSYGFVPLYRFLCQATGYIGNIKLIDYNLTLNQYYSNKILTITFNSDTNNNLPITFTPKQKEINIISGQTTLIFYSLINKTNKDFYGIATYNITPPTINNYFNKIECFCFEEQHLYPFEKVDLPVFFFIDPMVFYEINFLDINEISLSYTFYSVKK